LKIINFIPTLGLGGAEKFLVQLCNTLAKDEKNKVTLCTLYGPEHNDNNLIKELNPKVELVQFNKKSGFSLGAIFAIIRYLMNERPDVVNSHIGAIKYLLFAIILIRKTAFFHTIHTYPEKEEKNKLVVFVKKILSKSKRLNLIALSEISVKNAQLFYNLDFVKAIPNGISFKTFEDQDVKNDLVKLRFDSETKLIAHVGRIHPVKNQKMMTDAFRTLFAEGLNIALIFIGYSTEEHKDIEKSLFSEKSKNIHFLGKKSNAISYVKYCDGFTLSSFYEGFPISLLESLSVGTIPLCVPVGGIPDIISHGYNGFLSKDSSSENYLNMLRIFADLSHSEINRYRENAVKSYLEKFTMVDCANEYQKFYIQKLIKN